MLISFENVQIGDEIIIPSNSNLKYLKVIGITKSGCLKCSIGRYDFPYTGWRGQTWIKQKFTPDVSKHDETFYLKNDGGYTDIWLVRRENNE